MLTNRERQILKLIEEDPLISQQDLAENCGITRSSVGVHISNLIKKGAIVGKGYLLQNNPYVVVIGGLNLDIYGMPYKKLIKGDSNPGIVRMSEGGVGRNIAHNLALLGEDVKMITAFGSDNTASSLEEHCRLIGIDVTHALHVAGGASSTYLFIADENGEMQLAVSDMQIYEKLTPEFFKTKLDFISRASVCVMETNLTEESIDYLLKNITCPIFVDAVSTKKAEKLIGKLGYINTIKANRLEAELLTKITLTTHEDYKKAADYFIAQGVKQAFISLGAEGLYCANAQEQFLLKPFSTNIISTTGAGDSLMAALVWAYKEGFVLKQQGLAGQASAKICMESEQTVSPHINPETIESLIK